MKKISVLCMKCHFCFLKHALREHSLQFFLLVLGVRVELWAISYYRYPMITWVNCYKSYKLAMFIEIIRPDLPTLMEMKEM